MAEHADIGPSALDRVLNCPGSFRLSKQAEAMGVAFGSNYDSRLGTAAHTLGAWCFEQERDAAFFIGTTIEVEGEKFTVDEEMAEYVQAYVDHCRMLPGDEQWVEQRVEIPEFGNFGTVDFAKFHRETKTLYIRDYKNGVTPVPAEDNPQTKAYGLGMVGLLELVEDIEIVNVGIVQPRIDNVSWVEHHVDELRGWAAVAGPVIETARTAKDAPIRTGDHCKFCPAKALCPELRKLTVDVTGIEFTDVSAEGDPGSSEDGRLAEQLAADLPKLDLIEDWVTERRQAAQRWLEQGKPLPGYKLVAGRRGNRAWSNAAEAESLLKSKFRLPVDDIYEKKLIGPPAAERLLAKSSPRRWEQLKSLVTQSAGRPTVVPATDKRPAIERVPTQFDDLSTEEPLA